MAEDNSKLIENCINKDEASWADFIDKFSGLVYYSARERLKRSGISFASQDLEDIVQAVFLELWQKGSLKLIADRTRVSGWLSMVSQTRALNYIRKKKERLLTEEESNSIDSLISEKDASYPEHELYPGFEKMLEGFSPREKLVLKLNIIHEKTHREIAELINIPRNTVSTIIARKKILLREKLKKMKEK